MAPRLLALIAAASALIAPPTRPTQPTKLKGTYRLYDVLVFMMLINPTGPCHWCPYFCHNRRASNADADAELQPVDPSNVKVLEP